MKKCFIPLVLFIFCSCTNNTSHSVRPQNKKKVAAVTDERTTEDYEETVDNKTYSKAFSKLQRLKLKQAESKDVIFKSIDFGFNLGYLGDMKKDLNYQKPLAIIKQDGIKDLRVYEPFTKNLMKQPNEKSQLLSSLTNQGFDVLLSLSNYPYTNDGSQLKDQDQNRSQMLGYTNRYAPTDLSAYGNYLNSFIGDIKNSGALDHIKFEIGNEPDAKKYFWGTPEEFIGIAKKTKSVLLKYNRPIYCCAFTSEFANNASEKNQAYDGFLGNNDFFRNVDLSFHFYQNAKYGFSNIKLPNLNNSIITEFNLFSFQKGSNNARSATTNSPVFGGWMIQLLDYAYTHDIKAVYLFKLVDNAGKEGSLGFFDADGNPKPSYDYFKKIFSIVKDGYSIQKDNQSIQVIGRTQKAVFSLVKNLSLNAKSTNALGRSSAGSAKASQTLQKGDWVIVDN